MSADEPARPLDIELVGAAIAEDAAAWRADERIRDGEDRIVGAVRRTVPDLGADAAALIGQAERLADIDPYPPPTPATPALAAAKKVMRRINYGSFHHFGAQVAALGATLAAALRELDGRTSRLERRLQPALELPPPPALSPEAVATCARMLAGTLRPSGPAGPVVHLRAGDGELVAALRADGIEAYGIEPLPDLVVRARSGGRDVRRGSLAHLEGLAPATLAGVVLSGDVDVVAAGVLLDCLAATRAALAPGGRLVVATCDRDTWAARAPVLADLAPGRPLHPDTWRLLLGRVDLELDEAVRVEPSGDHRSGRPPPAITVLAARRPPLP